MSFEMISERLKALQESNTQLKELINRLATINFQPGSVPLGDNDEENVMQELAAEIHSLIREEEEDFDLLNEEVEECDEGKRGSEMESQKVELKGAVMRGRRELRLCQAQFRKAQILAKRSLVAAQRAERDLLLQSYLEPRSGNSSPAPGQQRRNQQNIELSKDEKTVNASSDVTMALRRTHDMMAAELARSKFAHETLNESTAALAQLSETYSTLDTLLSSSKNLLGTLLRSQKSDTWYLETAFYILVTTIGWLVWRRLLYGPTWWLVWFPMKIFIRSWMGVFTFLGLFGGDPEKEAASVSVSPLMSSMVSQATVIHSSGTRGSRATGGPPNSQHVQAGGGGEDAFVGHHQGSVSASSEESMSEQVGKIVDEIQNHEGAEEAPAENPQEEEPVSEEAEPRNPKKRMWEEPPQKAEQQAQKKHDEL
ncbi:related to protein transport membrane glycoprotein Sec20 [Rhynchosporium graminicola]|uniref:Related to protein transport membrane glycoprotein Sec20 n=1 Tax=Rhynchosporium graminicola TaxID=2792576 RepID=A0A1E1K9P5_9HELO|nr:related to protein transport membrane glycoprotein Sec20 [Rhynchosporium commune]